jgi:hypothetical protein
MPSHNHYHHHHHHHRRHRLGPNGLSSLAEYPRAETYRRKFGIILFLVFELVIDDVFGDLILHPLTTSFGRDSSCVVYHLFCWLVQATFSITGRVSLPKPMTTEYDIGLPVLVCRSNGIIIPSFIPCEIAFLLTGMQRIGASCYVGPSWLAKPSVCVVDVCVSKCVSAYDPTITVHRYTGMKTYAHEMNALSSLG